MSNPRPLQTSLADPFVLGDWTVHVAANRISRDGATRKLEPRTMSVLVYLAERAGTVVTREKMEADVWRGMVVGYDALSNAIAKLRKALDDDRHAPTAIETIPKTGYRLIANVETGDASAASLVPAPQASGTVLREATGATRRRRTSGVGLAALAFLAATAVAASIVFWPREDVAPLRSAGTPAGDIRASIAILPFENLGQDPEQEYFSDGMTDDLITELSKVPNLRVIARGSSFPYKNRNLQLDELARELGVRYLVEGSVRRTGGRLRVNAKLFDTGTDRYLWAERYDGALADVFKLHDEVTREIASVLEFELADAPGAAPGDRERVSVDAYDAYLRGWSLLQRKTPADAARALLHLERALALEPDFGRAHAARAQAFWEYAIDPQFNELTAPPRAGWDPGGYMHYLESWRSLRRTRARLSSQSLALGARLLQQQRRFDEAMRDARRAVALGPSDPAAHDALIELLIYAGETREALERIHRTIALDPARPGEKLFLEGLAHYVRGDLHDAITALARARLHNPLQTRYAAVQAAALAELGRLGAARHALEEFLAGWPSYPSLNWVMFHWPFQARQVAERLAAGLIAAGMEDPGEKYLWVVPENRLGSDEIETLLAKRTMVGIDQSYYEEVPFEVAWDERPRVVEQRRLKYFREGAVARFEAGLFCAPWQDLGDYCVAVYRNPGGTLAQKNEFLFYTLTGLFSFAMR